MIKVNEDKQECPECEGWGYLNHDNRNQCDKCDGSGVIDVKE